MTKPRVLIISPSVFNQYSGGGVLLTNLFRGWPRDSIAIVHGDPLPRDEAVCSRFFKVGISEVRWSFPFSLIQSKRTVERSVPGGQGVRLDSPASASRAALKRLLGAELPWTATLSPALAAWIDAFKPELIYTLPGGAYMRLALAVADRWKVPVVTHMMDDWPSAPQGGLLGPLVGARLRADLRRLFERSSVAMAISEGMAEEFGRRYGKTFLPFQNPVDLASRLPGARGQWTRESDFKLAYVGSILPQSQRESLGDISRAVSALAARGLSIRLDIYSAWSRGNENAIEPGAAVAVHDALDDSAIFQTLTRADLLVLPVNFDGASLRFIRYSMPAKVPLYLASGTPILVYGPPDAASVEYAKRERWGYVVSERNPELLEGALRRLAGEEDLRRELAQRAFVVARERHDADIIRAAFQKTLTEVVP